MYHVDILGLTPHNDNLLNHLLHSWITLHHIKDSAKLIPHDS